MFVRLTCGLGVGVDSGRSALGAGPWGLLARSHFLLFFPVRGHVCMMRSFFGCQDVSIRSAASLPVFHSNLQFRSLNVRTSSVIYAATLKAVKTTTTFPLVLNLFLPSPSSPTSLKNCLFPCCLRYALTKSTPAP